MPAVVPDPKFKMPAIYRPANEQGFRCKIGYFIGAGGVRKWREFRLGADSYEAHQKALHLARLWQLEEQRHLRLVEEFAQMFTSGPEAAAHLDWMPEAEAAGRKEYLVTPPEDLPGDIVDAAPVSTTLLEASLDLLNRVLGKCKRDARSVATYTWYEREFRLGMVKGAIDPTTPANAISLNHIESYCDYWCDLESRARESQKGRFGYRSACNRMDALAFLLRDLKGRVPHYQYPERADQTFADYKATVEGDATAIYEYDPDVLRTILAGCGNRVRAYIYCALNFGMYQSDIGQQVRRRHTEDDGGLVELDGEQYLQYHRHKLKRKRREMVRKKKKKVPVPVLLTHHVWPETLRLMNEFAAPVDNLLNVWFLNSGGLPLWRQEPDHRRAVDNISGDYYEAVKGAEVSLPFDQIRKFGGTAAESMSTREVQEMYRGERRQGSSRVYVLKDFTAKLTPFLKAWGDRLRADGVLY